MMTPPSPLRYAINGVTKTDFFIICLTTQMFAPSTKMRKTSKLRLTNKQDNEIDCAPPFLKRENTCKLCSNLQRRRKNTKIRPFCKQDIVTDPHFLECTMLRSSRSNATFSSFFCILQGGGVEFLCDCVQITVFISVYRAIQK